MTDSNFYLNSKIIMKDMVALRIESASSKLTVTSLNLSTPAAGFKFRHYVTDLLAMRLLSHCYVINTVTNCGPDVKL